MIIKRDAGKGEAFPRDSVYVPVVSRAMLPMLLAAWSCFSSAEELPSEQDLFAEFPVASATRLAQSPQDLPVSVTVIDRDMIEAMGVTELADVFRIVAGFKVGRVSGGMYSVAGHGIGDHFSRRLMVLIDGRPIQYPILKLVDWNAIPLEIDDVNYIEVMRGTSAAVYGSNAFDGAINIVTHKPFERLGKHVRLLVGQPGVASGLFSYGFSAFGGSHSLTLSDKRGDGFDNIHDGHHFSKLRYRGSFSPSINDELDVQFGLSHGYLEQGSEGVNRRRDTDIDYQYIDWKHRYDNGDDLTFKLYRNHTVYDDPIVTSGLRTIQPFMFKASAQRLGVDVARSFVFQDLRIVAGGNLHRDKIDSETQGERRDQSRQLYTSLEWQAADEITLNGSLMLEDTSNTKPTLSPRASVNYHLNRNNTVRLSAARSLRVSAARAFGSATAEDRPEKVTSYEIGHLLTLPVKGLSIDSKLYYDRYDDIPVVARDSNNRPRASVGGFAAKGLDVQLKYTPSSNILVAGQYAYADIGDQTVSNPQSSLTYEDYGQVMPRHMFTALLSRKFQNSWQTSLTYTYVSEMEWKGWGDPVDGYHRLDARVAKDIRVLGKRGKLELIGQNLINEYTEFQDGNIMDRRVLLRVSISDL